MFDKFALKAYVIEKLTAISAVKNILEYISSDFVLVFVFHRVALKESDAARFHTLDELDELLVYMQSNGVSIISVEQLINSKFSPSDGLKVAFTMDDGYLDQGVCALHFAKRNVPISLALVNDLFLGESVPWDRQLEYLMIGQDHPDREELESFRDKRHQLKSMSRSEIDKIIKIESIDKGIDMSSDLKGEYLDQETISAMIASPLISFLPHSKSHYIFSRLSDEEVRKEIVESKVFVRRYDNSIASCFVFPNGKENDFKDHDIRLLKKENFSHFMTTTEGYYSIVSPIENEGVRRIDRIEVPRSLSEAKYLLSGFSVLREGLAKEGVNFIRNQFGGISNSLKFFLKTLLFRKRALRARDSIHWEDVTRIVFFCEGNICRSAYAIIKYRELHRNPKITIASFGLSAPDGDIANSVALSAAQRRGVDLVGHRTSSFKREDFQSGDLLVGFEQGHLKRVEKRLNGVDVQYLLLPTLAGKDGFIVFHDPYGRSKYYFEKLFGLMDSALIKLAELSNGGVHG